MRTVPLSDEKEMRYIDQAESVARNATCSRSKCGSIIVKDGEIIGEGYNSPPKGLDSQCRCSNSKDSYHKKVTDKTCCMHAEQRAIMDALSKHPQKLPGSILYFIRLDKDGSKSFSGNPYCTICSKMALDAGIAEFVLMHKQGLDFYDAEEYNDLSFQYNE